MDGQKQQMEKYNLLKIKTIKDWDIEGGDVYEEKKSRRLLITRK